ncbi:hypothetical protein SLS60_007450 [Paraconiothyrium brasiliense]|uniref:Uncharacterized protein n=1 Tax=Paraconiothyrium brasiliense TaxID=300254 RepID=A0ABR3R5L9_9PLEO
MQGIPWNPILAQAASRFTTLEGLVGFNKSTWKFVNTHKLYEISPAQDGTKNLDHDLQGLQENWENLLVGYTTLRYESQRYAWWRSLRFVLKNDPRRLEKMGGQDGQKQSFWHDHSRGTSDGEQNKEDEGKEETAKKELNLEEPRDQETAENAYWADQAKQKSKDESSLEKEAKKAEDQWEQQWVGEAKVEAKGVEGPSWRDSYDQASGKLFSATMLSKEIPLASTMETAKTQRLKDAQEGAQDDAQEHEVKPASAVKQSFNTWRNSQERQLRLELKRARLNLGLPREATILDLLKAKGLVHPDIPIIPYEHLYTEKGESLIANPLTLFSAEPNHLLNLAKEASGSTILATGTTTTESHKSDERAERPTDDKQSTTFSIASMELDVPRKLAEAEKLLPDEPVSELCLRVVERPDDESQSKVRRDRSPAENMEKSVFLEILERTGWHSSKDRRDHLDTREHRGRLVPEDDPDWKMEAHRDRSLPDKDEPDRGKTTERRGRSAPGKDDSNESKTRKHYSSPPPGKAERRTRGLVHLDIEHGGKSMSHGIGVFT